MGVERCSRCDAGVPADARFCPACGNPVTSKPTAAGPREERKVVAALFADVVGSTRLGERLDPEDFRSVVGGAVSRMAAAVEELGGTIHGTAGDGVLGLFGAPQAREDDPERAVLAGLRMVERLDAYGREASAQWEIEPLAVRVGIETGLAVLGEARAGTWVSYEASGDCLNTAARLQGEAAPGGVLVGPLTHRLVVSLFEWDEPRSLTLKGKADPVVARRVRAARHDAKRATASHVRLVGRDRELALAEEAARQLLAGDGCVTFVVGDAGIGKTRLVGEMQQFFAGSGQADPRPRWLEGHCRSYASDEPYLPFRQVLRQALGLTAVEAPAAAREAAVRVLGVDEAERLGPFIQMLAGIGLDDTEAALEHMPREALQRLAREAAATVLAALARQAPLVIVLDDFHWADASSVRLARDLLPLAAEAPVLFVVAMRSEPGLPATALRERIKAELAGRVFDLELDTLSPEAERALLAELIGAGTLPEGLERQLLERAEGNPFYLGELVRSLLDAGTLVRSGDSWRLDREAPFELPESVERVVVARMDRLASADRELLTCAAVLGRQFELPLLRRIAREREVTSEAIAGLRRSDLIEEVAPGHEYRFRHSLIQQAAYNSLLRARRSELHGRAAAAIEEVSGELTEEHFPALARHHRAAGNHEAAVRYHRLAARAAERALAFEEELTHLDEAISVAGTLPDADRALAELHLERGRARARSGDFAAGAGDLRLSLRDAGKTGDGALQAQILTDLGWLTRGTGYAQAIEYHERALAAADEAGDEATRVAALSRLSLIHSNTLQLDRALELAERAMSIARQGRDDETVARALDSMKLAAFQLGDLDRLDATTSELVAIQRRGGDQYLTQWASIEGTFVPLARGDHAEALARVEEVTKLNARLGDKIAKAMILEVRSWIERSRGELDGALRAIGEAGEIVHGLGTSEWIAWVEATRGSHLLEDAKPGAALEPLQRALTAAEEVGTPNRLLRATSHLAWAHALLGEPEAAREAAARAEALLDRVTAPPGQAFLNGYHAYLALARARLALAEPESAEQTLRPLLDAARSAGWQEAAAYASLLIGTALAARGDRDGAAARLADALAAAGDRFPCPAREARASLAEFGSQASASVGTDDSLRECGELARGVLDRGRGADRDRRQAPGGPA